MGFFEGNIPGPIVFASVVDRSCIQWTRGALNGNKTCRLYNNKSFSTGLGSLGACFRFLSGLFALLTLISVRKFQSHDLYSATISNLTQEKKVTQIEQTEIPNNNGFVNKAFVDEEKSIKFIRMSAI